MASYKLRIGHIEPRRLPDARMREITCSVAVQRFETLHVPALALAIRQRICREDISRETVMAANE